MKLKEIDFIERINLFLETIYYDGERHANTILFEYDPSYPRVYKIDASNTIKCIENLTKIFLFFQSECEILIKFKLANYNTNRILFNILISSSERLKEFDQELLNAAKEYGDKAGIIIRQDKNGNFILDIEVELASDAQPTKSLDINNQAIKNYNAIIAYDNKNGFKILSNQLKFIGINVKPSSDYESLKQHITDAIYNPDLAFVQKVFLEDEQNLNELLKFKKMKHFCIVAICETDEIFKPEIKQELIILREPYSYDILRAVLDMCYERKERVRDGVLNNS
ncbi:hypothetical protein [Campylobacter sp. 7477a]|uniref:hypothetical protein n=1 Tax=Campylobacter sp. 7477a TaxID=2735741 RepID=UPI003014B077|nr:hypothetical protein [Campylobacter sp. 7477a]